MYNPEELVTASIAERLIKLEHQYTSLQNSVDRSICDNLQLRDKLEHFDEKSKFSYANAAGKHIPTHYSDINATKPMSSAHSSSTSVNPAAKTANLSGFFQNPCTFKGSNAMSRSQSILSLDRQSTRSVDSEGFRKPTHHLKKQRRNLKAVTGKAQVHSQFKGAQAYIKVRAYIPPRRKNNN